MSRRCKGVRTIVRYYRQPSGDVSHYSLEDGAELNMFMTSFDNPSLRDAKYHVTLQD